ncbi:hypothetical protein N7526_001656 [Penicillium atrosanguineum]|nr:hypothetical protein N7526_001656 [Penicillium atrosanguineum]
MASLKGVNDMEGVIGSLFLSLPCTFHILPTNTEIDKSKWHEHSWIICSNIALECSYLSALLSSFVLLSALGQPMSQFIGCH